MKLIELHILQSFPVSCLNRDDVGAPKTAIFGGAIRARISSQCLKRAIRTHAKETCPSLFAAERSKLIVKPIAEAIEAHRVPADTALDASRKFCEVLAKFDEGALKKKNILKVKTLMFLSPLERERIGTELAQVLLSKKKIDDTELQKKIKAVVRKVPEAQLLDAADVALFGRMVAADHSLTVEGAAMFSHALSTHRADNDIDFYTAVDDRQSEDPSVEDEDRAGSGMMGTLEFTSATYYRYIGLNLGMLEDAAHLGAMSAEQRRQVMDSFIRASILALPGARKNSMNAYTLPGYVLGVVRESGQPLQLVNAFEKPVRSGTGLMQSSISELEQHWAQLKTTWDIKPKKEVFIPKVTLAGFCKEILNYV